MSDLDEIWDSIHSMGQRQATCQDSINTLNDRTMNTDVALRNSKGDIIERLTEQNRDLMTLRERVESIAAEVQRMKDKEFPPTAFTNYTHDQLLDAIEGNAAFIARMKANGTEPTNTKNNLSELRAEVRRRLNNT